MRRDGRADARAARADRRARWPRASSSRTSRSAARRSRTSTSTSSPRTTSEALLASAAAEQLTFWRSREAAIFVFLFPPLLFVLLASVFGDGIEDGRPVVELSRRRPDRLRRREHRARRPRDHARDPARVRDPEAAPLDAAARQRSTSSASWSRTCSIVVLQSLTVIALGVLLFDAELPEACALVRPRARDRAPSRFAGLGLAAAALIRSAEAVAAVVNVIILPMSFLSGAFGTTDDLPRVLELVADVLPLKYLIELVLATYVDGDPIWDHLGAIACHGGLGRRRLPGRPRPLRLGAARALEDLRSQGRATFNAESRPDRLPRRRRRHPHQLRHVRGPRGHAARRSTSSQATAREVDAITIVAEQRTIADHDVEASVHQIRIELGDEDPQRPLLLAARWAEACVAERHAEFPRKMSIRGADPSRKTLKGRFAADSAARYPADGQPL